MAIIIQNIDPNPRSEGVHQYCLRVNERAVCTFEHERKEDLAACLRKAADAAERAERNRREMVLRELVGRVEDHLRGAK